MSEDKAPAIKFADLPPITDLKARPRMETVMLLEELDALMANLAVSLERKKEIDERLEAIQLAAKVPGFRHGSLCFFTRAVPGKKTLDKTLLIENGVTPEIIQQSMKTGKGYMEHRFKNIQKGGDDGGE